MAMKVNDEGIKPSYPSLYLNIGKCYEDLNDSSEPELYMKALSILQFPAG